MSECVYWRWDFISTDKLEVPILSQAESDVFNNFRFEARRQSWLAGRLTAKRLISQVLDEGLSIDQIEITNNALGAPSARVLGQTLHGTLSISHSGGWAAAAFTSSDLEIGIDLEQISPRSESFIQDYFTDGEIDLLGCFPASFELTATLIWSAKEAMLKAMGIGLRADTREVVVDSVGTPNIQEGVDWRPLGLRSSVNNSPWLGFWRGKGEFILTLAIIPKPGCNVKLIELT